MGFGEHCLPGREHDLAVRQRAGPVELVRGEQHRAALFGRGPQDRVEDGAAGLVEPSVRLVEEQEPWIARPRHAQSEPAALPRRQLPVSDVAGCFEADAFHRSVCGCDVAPDRPRGEAQVLSHGEVVVAERFVSDEREFAPSAPPVPRKVDPEHDRLARVQGHETCDQTQQCGLARAVRAREEHDLARGDIEVHPGEGGEAIEEADGGAETDDGGHTRLRAVDDRRV